MPLRVFREMQSLGMRASEMGPHGNFALDDVAEEIRGSDFSIVAGFMVLGFRFPGGLVKARVQVGADEVFGDLVHQ